MTLVCYDLDGTLITSYMIRPDRDYDAWVVLDGRQARVQQHIADGHRIAIVTNQGGVGLGFVTAAAFAQKIGAVLRDLGVPATTPTTLLDTVLDESAWGFVTRYPTPISIHTTYGHRNSRDVRYADPVEVARRKPSASLIEEAMRFHGVPCRETVMVGDMETDRQAAHAAGVRYEDAADWFGV